MAEIAKTTSPKAAPVPSTAASTLTIRLTRKKAVTKAELAKERLEPVQGHTT